MGTPDIRPGSSIPIDLNAVVHDELAYRGMAGAFVAEERFYSSIFSVRCRTISSNALTLR